jgi:cell division protein FtsX
MSDQNQDHETGERVGRRMGRLTVAVIAVLLALDGLVYWVWGVVATISTQFGNWLSTPYLGFLLLLGLGLWRGILTG